MDEFRYKPIGVVHTPFTEPRETPIQPTGEGIEGEVEVFPQYAERLKDLEGFSHIILVYHFHLSKTAKPYLDTEARGVFATAAPADPTRLASR